MVSYCSFPRALSASLTYTLSLTKATLNALLHLKMTCKQWNGLCYRRGKSHLSWDGAGVVVGQKRGGAAPLIVVVDFKETLSNS